MKRHIAKQRRQLRRPKVARSYKKLACLIIVIMNISLLATSAALAKDRVESGARDISRGVGSVPTEIAKTANETNIINGIVLGGARGLLYSLRSIGEGVFKIATFHLDDD
ncbi:hypothetical protein ACFL0T_01185 [Candidatus Omnitrophota bacterium]